MDWYKTCGAAKLHYTRPHPPVPANTPAASLASIFQHELTHR
ncbi:hypothetical protein SNOG_16021 [Parastagonospora nodorum SN15]|uniref:Uncharacterized protein n=1 Tax=Phaeosphaeria nodorum (strain SN15 / ATCC MYA-4574 / FGSC 10173) TaxID=321614 RepID=Q0TWV3_PHANO|nr:hypothetical protein SNOG_16021 [Parastagonospora nodorum SN15]EAT76600.1 hypothetical protein SNOG_16021 [Parastagonospora nodorum SN15]